MPNPTITIEFYDGTAWRDITGDVIMKIKWGHGITSQGPTDRVASAGMLNLEMNNSVSNSGAKVGYYSRDHANTRTGWVLGAKIRTKLVSGGNTRYDLYKIKKIVPSAGQYKDRRVKVTAADYMDEMENRKVSGLTVQTNQYGGALFTTLIATMPIAPTATSYDTGLYLLPYSFHDEANEATYCISVAQKIAQSDMSYIYVDGDSTGGETLRYEQPQARYHNTTSAATFTNTMIELSLSQDVENVFNKVKITTNPVEIGTPGEVLATYDGVVSLEPSETNKKITLRYVDQGSTRRISAMDLITPVAGTDYIMSSVSGSESGDMNGDLTISFTDNGNNIQATLTNGSSTRKGFIKPLQARGTKVTTFNKVESEAEDSTSITAYTERTIDFNMPYQTSTTVGETVAAELLRRHKDPATQIQKIKYNANRSTTFMGYALTLGIGSRITITEAVSGISTAFFINAVEFELEDDILNVSYVVEKAFGASGATYFKLDTNTFADTSILIPL